MKELVRERVVEETAKWVAERPITFEQFLDMDFGDACVELIDGSVVEKPMVQLEHERLFSFIYTVMTMYTSRRNLGIVLGSRTPVQISGFRGRLPDIVFVSNSRMDTVTSKAIRDAPDLVIEISSPSDRPSNSAALETDYCALGVPEIWFIDQRRRRIRVLRLTAEGYVEEILTDGDIISSTVADFALRVEWLLADAHPTPDEALAWIGARLTDRS